jgi:hypothetical protein
MVPLLATLAEIQPLALNLPESQRTKLAADLLDSLPGVLVDDDGGLAEALRRSDEMDRDPAACLSHDQFRHVSTGRPAAEGFYKSSHFRNKISSSARSCAVMRPTTFRTNLISTVQICPLIPLGTFSPAFAHWLTSRSAFASCEVTATTNRSPGQLPWPTTMAGLTFELLKSVNGIGSKTTSSREQISVNVVGCVIPDPHERTLPLVQPSPPLHIVLPGFQ